MTDKVKLIIEIPKYYLECPQNYTCLAECVRRGTPLDDVKAEIVDKAIKDANGEGFIFLGRLLRIFDNIGKERSE